MTEQRQSELFEEFKKEKGKFEQFASKITGKQQKLYVSQPLENVIFASIIVMLSIVVSFALGVERGKNINREGREVVEAPPEETITLAAIEVTGPEAKPPQTRAPVPEKNNVKARYTIQLVSYKSPDQAEKEKNKLLNKNIDAFIMPSGNWYQICAGGYKDMDEAKSALKKFKLDYKDSFIREGEK